MSTTKGRIAALHLGEVIAAGRAAFVAAAETNRFDGYEIWDLERKVYESKESAAQVDK